MENYIKSPMNYTGGKYKLLKSIMPVFPKNANNFVDLFAGGFNVGINAEAKTIYANERIPQLVDIYRLFQSTNTDQLITDINARIAEYGLSKTNGDGYALLREEYNRNKNALDLFVLICYSFNNIIRFNARHDFNTPFGRGRSSFNSSIERNLIEFCEALHRKRVVFSDRDFKEFDYSVLESGDFVYCDPPYLITTAPYNDGSRGFSDWTKDEDAELFRILDKLNSKGILFALSNVFTHKGNANEGLIEWSKKYNVGYMDMDYLHCSYNLKDDHKNTTEVLITNFDFPKSEYEQLALCF